MLLSVDEIMGMARTMNNVTGDALASTVFAKWEGELGTGPSKEDQAIIPTEPQ